MRKEKHTPFQFGYFGERASVRLVNKDSLDDRERMLIAEQWEQARFCVDTPIDTDIGMYSFLNAVYLDPMRDIYAVSGNLHTPEPERFKLQGWVMLDAGEKTEAVAQSRLGDSYVYSPRPIEVSYLRYPSAEPHQMASALRQICTLIGSRDAAVEWADRPERNVIAQVLSYNESSQRVLQAAGFDHIRSYTQRLRRNQEQATIHLFLLDWYKLDRIMHKKADQFFLGQ